MEAANCGVQKARTVIFFPCCVKFFKVFFLKCVHEQEKKIKKKKSLL